MPGPLPWQQSQWQHLLQRKAAGRLPHALLLTGSAGLGKALFAQGFAQLLLCAAPTAEGLPCGVCRNCRLVVAGTHPDYLRVEPAETGKPIKVDQIRELCDFLGYTSQLGSYKVVLLVPAEQMNVSAANSLLKTLEEPPPTSLLLLVTAFPSRLPATVRSRCQSVSFNPPPPHQTLSWIAAQVEGETDPALLLSLGGGAPLRALACAGNGYLARRRELFNTYCLTLSGELDPIQAAASWKTGDVAENVRWLISWHMDMIRLKMGNDAGGITNPDLQAALRSWAAQSAARTLFQRLDAATRLLTLCVTPVNVQLMLEAFFVDCTNARL